VKLKFTLIWALLILGNLHAADSIKTESMTVPISRDSAKSLMSVWQNRLHQTNVLNNQILLPNGERAYLLTGRIPYVATDSRIEIDSLASDSCRISSSFQTYLSSKAAELIVPHLQGTARQAANQNVENGRELHSKSLSLYLGLSAVNFGLGGMYLKNDNFTLRPNYFLIAANGVFDAGSVAMMLSGKHSVQVLGISVFVLYRAIALLQIPLLNLHNKFAETGYQYAF